ncbi:hypothetical protein SSX86_020907 [Deinandra increscens subsp. villosa]|uniref:Gnk2-homologous domain-containing protein n=1 Tax=Deinandra increscens subsp. villosa TaxID=3103831 RepID=A0AAP0CVN0_9ASTR
MGDVIAGTGGSGIKRLYPPSQKTCGGVPQWVKVMIDIMQYQDCKIHSNAKDNKLDRFCIDCVGSFCNQCSSDHQGHEHIKLNFTSTTSCDESNVNSLFASLIESASVYNFNKFQISQQNNGVYGLYQCRGDISSPNCKDCVANAVNQLKSTCPMSVGGQIQLEACFLKYDNRAFFGAQGKTEACKTCGPSIGYNSDVLNRIDGALATLVGGNGQYFRSGEFGNIRGVAQCVQDLSLSDCEDCLSEASGQLRSECVTSNWGDMYLGKCYIRYAADQVRNITQIRNERDKYKKEAESAESEAKLAKKRAEEAEKKAEDEKRKHESMSYLPCGPPMPMPMLMPPPCPYLPHSSPNLCSYM